MKKSLMIAVLLMTVTAMNAQSDPGTFSLTPKVGVSIANLSDNDLVVGDISLKSKYKAGFIVGAEGEYQITDFISATLGAYYATLGNRYDDYEKKTENASTPNIQSLEDYHNNYTILGYVLVPVMAKVYVAPGLALQAGVQAGFLTNARSEYKLATATLNTQTGERTSGGTTKYKDTSKDGYKTTDFSIPFGLTYEYAKVVIDARYNLGLTKVYKNALDSKNRFFTFTVGYKFDL
jgi:hypothetical protein